MRGWWSFAVGLDLSTVQVVQQECGPKLYKGGEIGQYKRLGVFLGCFDLYLSLGQYKGGKAEKESEGAESKGFVGGLYDG